MSEWLDLMLEEIARKKREQDEGLEELQRRKTSPQADDKTDDKADDRDDDSPARAQAK